MIEKTKANGGEMRRVNRINIVEEAYLGLVNKRKHDSTLPSKEKVLKLFQSYQIHQIQTDNSTSSGKFIHFTTKRPASLIYTQNSETR